MSKTGPVLDGTDLATVEAGASGMRLWTVDETRLVEASRRAEEQEKAQEQERARRLHEAQERERQAAKDAKNQARRAEKGLRIANAQRLAAFAREGIRDRPQQALILAVEALRATQDHGEPIIPAAEQAFWEASSIQGRGISGHEDAINALAFAPDGRLVTGSEDRTVRVWDLNDLDAQPVVLGHEDAIRALAFAPDGRLVTGSSDKTVRVWDLTQPDAQPVVLRAHAYSINALTFAPDGRLVTGSDDGTVRVWDLNDPDVQPVVLRGHEGSITALAFAPDGRLVTGSGDRTVRVWDFDLTNQIERAGRVACRNLTNLEWLQFFGREPYRRTFPELPDGLGVADGPESV